jgi:hypothetical protein
MDIPTLKATNINYRDRFSVDHSFNYENKFLDLVFKKYPIERVFTENGNKAFTNIPLSIANNIYSLAINKLSRLDYAVINL